VVISRIGAIVIQSHIAGCFKTDEFSKPFVMYMNMIKSNRGCYRGDSLGPELLFRILRLLPAGETGHQQMAAINKPT